MSSSCNYHLADVFTDRPFAGNPLAVFPDGRGISSGLMQQIARELNLSETVFVLPASAAGCACRLRIFTPVRELPFAGHPTIGTAHVLAAIGAIPLLGDDTRVVFEEGIGPVPVNIRARGGRPVFAQLTAAQLPQFGPQPPPPADIAAALSLAAGDFLPEYGAPRAASCGMPFLFVPVRDRAVLRRARVNMERWEAALSGYWAPQVFVFTPEVERPGSSVRARMFAPDAGVAEDPATGSAAAALAGYLGARAPRREGTSRWTVEQGFEMGRPSILEVEADWQDGEISAVRVGGASVLVGQGSIAIPDAPAATADATAATPAPSQ